MLDEKAFTDRVILYTRIGLSALVTIAALISILVPSVAPETKWWAYFTMGLVIGYWLS